MGTGDSTTTSAQPVNPYGGGPSSGLQFPPYYKPTPSVRSRKNYFPGSETLGPDEMRISFVGSCPFPPRRDQAGTCIMVELGNGDRFFFDFGPGCVKNILAMGVPVPEYQRHLHHPPARRPLPRPVLSAAVLGVGRTVEAAAAGHRALRTHAGTRHQGHGRRHEADAQVAPGSLRRLPDRRRLRGRGQRVRLEGRERHLLRQERRHDPPLAALARQGRRLGLPAGLERPFVRVDRRRSARRADRQVRQGRRCLCHRAASPIWRASTCSSTGCPNSSSTTPSTSTTRWPTPRATSSSRSTRAVGMVTHLAFDNDTLNEHKRRHSRPLERAVPVRRAGRGDRQRDQGRDLAPGRRATRHSPASPCRNPTLLVRRPAAAGDRAGRRATAQVAARATAGATDARPRNRSEEVLSAGRLPRAAHQARRTRKWSICSRWRR